MDSWTRYHGARINNVNLDDLKPEEMPASPDVITVVSWPPKVIQSTPMGYIQDCSGNYLPRDIGRSSLLSDGSVIFQFGDTFGNEFLGLVDHTVASKCLEGHGPTCSVSSNKMAEAPSTEKRLFDGYEPETFVPKPVLPIDRVEPLQSNRKREATWLFSGIVDLDNEATKRYGIPIEEPIAEGELKRDSVYGYTWFEAREFDKENADSDGKYLLSGIATLHITPDESGKGTDVVTVSQDHLFGSDEPRFGTFCAVASEDGLYAYCYGHLNGSGYQIADKHVGLARVAIYDAPSARKYKFWDGEGWTCDMKFAVPVLNSMQHGQIFQTNMFASEYPWAFLGCSSFGDSKAIFGRAKSSEGPWDCHPLEDLKTYSLIKTPDSNFRYCFYPHPWAFREDSPDLMITWCEGGMNGNVIAERVRFKSEKFIIGEDSRESLLQSKGRNETTKELEEISYI